MGKAVQFMIPQSWETMPGCLGLRKKGVKKSKRGGGWGACLEEGGLSCALQAGWAEPGKAGSVGTQPWS